MAKHNQSKFDIWSGQNIRNNGFTKGAKDVLKSVQTNKQAEYDSLRASVTDTEKIRIRELLYTSNSQIELMSRMADEGFNLNYLIALNITTEENVQSYLTLKARGIDTYGLQDLARAKSVDGGYLREIEQARVNYPDLLSVKGDNIQNTLDKEKYIKQETKLERTPITSESDNVPIIDLESISQESDTSVKDTKDTLIPQENTKEEIDKAFDWKKIIDDLKSQDSTLDATEQVALSVNPEDIVDGGVAPTYKEFDNNVRRVYLLANEFATPTIPNYEFIFIKDSNTLSKFTVNKNNLLILTQDIPKYVLNDFASWASGVIESGMRFRIATLSTSEVTHNIVEGVLLKLDKTSLDEFYKEHTTDNYIKESEGTFLDLSSIVDETEND